MNIKIVAICSFVMISALVSGQTSTDVNKTDKDGKKQGHWIKRYPNNNVMYDGFFKDDHPVGEFKRYFEDSTLWSLLIYSSDGKEANATLYHPNGFIASKGKYVNKMKEGKWQFFSYYIKDYLFSEEVYTKNLKNGPSTKYYPDSTHTVAERLTFINGIRQGEWVQFHPNGVKCLKATYLNGKINGKFEAFFENGKIEFSGQYKNEERDGTWLIYKDDGTLKYKIEYEMGATKNREMDIYESDFADALEKNKGRIADPEKTGVRWE